MSDQGGQTVALDVGFSDTDVNITPEFDAEATAQVTRISDDDFGTGTEVLDTPPEFTSQVPTLTEDAIDLDLNDLSAALAGDTGQTVEQLGPRADQKFSDEVFAGGGSDMGEDRVDLDVGDAMSVTDDEPTGTERIPAEELALPEAEAETLSEVGTKLDLARAYMDMGDPDGARNILQEVMEEGNDNQRNQAKRLIDGLP